MQKETVTLIENKLNIQLTEFDSEVLGGIRGKWKRFSPAVNCPTGDQIAGEIKSLCFKANKDREEVALRVFEYYLEKFNSQISRGSKKTLMSIASNHFPNDTYFRQASKTEEVFLRSNAPKLRLNKRQIDLELSLIDVDGKNIGRRTLKKIAHCIDESELLSRQNKVSPRQRLLLYFGRFFVIPTVKWIFYIVALVIVAAITYTLGIDG